MAHLHDTSFRSLTRYEEYYLAGGDLFFMVDHHMFRVHRYFFERESSYFKGKLATPPSPGATRQGTNESNAIVIDDVTAHEFARFLWVFYNPKYSLYHASVADWVAILNLSHRWAFPEVKDLAVRELERQPMGDVDRVVVYQENKVDRNLLIPCYAALCERDEPLTAQEGRRMGIETSLTIAHLREMARRSPNDCHSPAPATFHGQGLQSIVRELFEIPAPLEDDMAPVTPLVHSPPPETANGISITVNGPTSTTEDASTDGATNAYGPTGTGTTDHSASTNGTGTGAPHTASALSSTDPTKTGTAAGAGAGANAPHTGAGQVPANGRPIPPINTRVRNSGNGNADSGVEGKDKESKEGKEGGDAGDSCLENGKNRRKASKRPNGN